MDLREAARRRGIQTEYWDGFGERHEPSGEVLRSILDALGPEIQNVSPPFAPDAQPLRMWQPPEDKRRCAGVAIGLYGLRSARNWGCGDLRDLRDFIDWSVDELGASFVALNPLHAIHNRFPYNTSPYLPLSTYYRNYLYLDVESVDGGSSLALPRRRLAELRASEFVEYEQVAQLKMEALRTAYAASGSPGGLDAYIAREGELLGSFALYCALDEHFRLTSPGTWLWTQWPEGYRNPGSSECRAFLREHEADVRFYYWLQWQLDRQLEGVQGHARERGMSIGLHHDLALATDQYGCDLWANPEHFAKGCRVGSPPDGFAPDGQDWSFPPPNSTAHLRDGYRLFAASIRQNARHGGALRMDHVMRLFRLFWIPEGFPAREGTYVEERWRDLLGVLARESHQLQIRIIGEDLGTITDEMRAGLAEYEVLGYRLLYFEREEDGSFKNPENYTPRAVASATTHDLPTLAGFWLGRDIEARRAAGLISADSYERQFAERESDKKQLRRLFADLGLDPHPIFAPLEILAATPCELLAINQEEITGEENQLNLPGSTSEYPNWRRRMKYSLEELRTNPAVCDTTRRVKTLLERSGRVQ